MRFITPISGYLVFFKAPIRSYVNFQDKRVEMTCKCNIVELKNNAGMNVVTYKWLAFLELIRLFLCDLNRIQS